MSITKQNLHISGLNEVYFPVTNAADSAEWYIRHFGLSRVGSAAGRETLRLQEGALLTLVESDRLNRYDAVPIQFKTHDALKAYEALDRSAVKAGETEKFHHYTDFDIWDPYGNRINVISDPAWPNTPNNYFKIDGIFIGVLDIARTHKWYTDVLGADVEYDFTYPTESLPAARHVCYLGIPLSLVESPKGELNYRVCDFRTADIAADYAFLKAKNVRVTELTESAGRLFFRYYDEDGREFGMVQDSGVGKTEGS